MNEVYILVGPLGIPSTSLRINFSPFSIVLKIKILLNFLNRICILVGPLGIEPRLFGTKNQCVASYTIGQYRKMRVQI